MCFVWIWEQTAFISLYSINCLVFITETVFTERYGLDTYVFGVDLRSNSDCFLIQSQLVGFYNRDEECLLRGTGCAFKYNTGPIPGQSMWFAVHKLALEQVSLRVILFYPVSIVPSMLHNLYSHAAPNRTNGRSLGTFQKAVPRDIFANLQRPVIPTARTIFVYTAV
jgi:hypothetical protein